MTIDALEKETGLTENNFKYYEQCGILPRREKEKDYSDVYVQQLRKVVKLRVLGIPLERVYDLMKRTVSLSEVVQQCKEEVAKLPEGGELRLAAYDEILQKNLTLDTLDELEFDEMQQEWRHQRGIALMEDVNASTGYFRDFFNAILKIFDHTGDGANMRR